MWYHRGAVATRVLPIWPLKNIQRFKANFVLTTYQRFMTRSAKLEQLWAAPQWCRIVLLLYCTPDLTRAVPPRAWHSCDRQSLDSCDHAAMRMQHAFEYGRIRISTMHVYGRIHESTSVYTRSPPRILRIPRIPNQFRSTCTRVPL